MNKNEWIIRAGRFMVTSGLTLMAVAGLGLWYS